MMFRTVFVVCVVCLVVASGWPPDGEYEIFDEGWPLNGVSDADDFPSYDERSTGLWFNVARIGYKWYRDKYVCPVADSTCSRIFDGSGEDEEQMSSVAPSFFSYNLNRAARAHSYDVVNHCWEGKNDHNDCNGTDLITRGHKFTFAFTWEIYINTAPAPYFHLFRGFGAIAAWMCDGYFGMVDDDPLVHPTGCANDAGTTGTTSGHRKGIMLYGDYWGCGVYGPEETGAYATTCDSATWTRSHKYDGLHIATASHTGDPNQTDKFMYMATIATTNITVKSMTITEETSATSTIIDMELLYQGTAGAIYTTPSYALYTDSCRSYYFELKYTNATGEFVERYPQAGYLYTYGMACNKNWRENNVVTDSASSVTFYGLTSLMMMVILLILA